MQSRFLRRILLIVSVVLVIGCSGRPSRVPISGKVLIDGKPLEFGTIVFIPDGARQSTGVIKDGNFTLSCFQPNDGALVGKHKIWVTSSELQKNDTIIKYFIPPRYGKADTSGLVQEIKAPNDSLVINLTWKGNKPSEPFTEPYGSGIGDADEGMNARIQKNKAGG